MSCKALKKCLHCPGYRKCPAYRRINGEDYCVKPLNKGKVKEEAK